MPTFRFEAMDATGQEIKDIINASDEQEAQSLVRQMGYFLTKISNADRKPLVERIAKIKKPSIALPWHAVGRVVLIGSLAITGIAGFVAFAAGLLAEGRCDVQFLILALVCGIFMKLL